MAGEPLGWVKNYNIAIQAIEYPRNGLLLCATVGKQVIVSAEGFKMEHAVIWDITDEAGVPRLVLTFRDSSIHTLDIGDIFWKKNGDGNHCMPVDSFLQLNEAIDRHNLRRTDGV